MRRKHTVVIGCGFAGIIAAIELKTRLGSEHDITVVSATDQFVFTPALTRLCFGSVDTGKYTFCIPPELEKRGIRFVHETVTYINLHERALFTKRGWELYDYLVIATGAKANYAGIPGLGARGYTQAILSISDAEKARAAWHRFMESPGPIVIGMAQGALYSSAVHEFLFRTVHEIWKRGLENQASITYVTFAPILEPSSKENGSTKGGRITELFRKFRIRAITSARMQNVAPGEVHLSDGSKLPFAYSMMMPPFLGVDAVRACHEVTDAFGFVRVDQYCRTQPYPEVFAAGVAVATETGEDALPLRNGHASEHMGVSVATNIAALIRGEKLTPLSCQSGDGHWFDIPDSLDSPGNLESTPSVIPGPEVRWAQDAFERYCGRRIT